MANKQIDALKNIGFRGSLNQFQESYKPEIEYLKDRGISDLKYKQILLAYFLHCKNSGEALKKTNVKKLTWRYGTFIKYIREFVKEQNQFYDRKGYEKKIKLSGNVRINKDNYYAYLTILGTEQKELAHSSKPVNDIIKEKMIVFADRTEKEISIIRGNKSLIRQLRFFFLKKGIKIIHIEAKEFPRNFFTKFFNDKNIKVYRIELRNTEISIGDEATIYSKSGEGKRYYQKFVDAGILQKENFGVYDIERIIFSYKNSDNNLLEFKRKRDYTKEIIFKGRGISDIPQYIQEISNKDNYWYSKLDNKKILRILIYNGYIDLYNKSHNKFLERLVEDLKFNNFLTSIPVIGFRCDNPVCRFFHHPTRYRLCPEPTCSRKNKEYIQYHKIELDFKKIIGRTGDSIKKAGFIRKYKTLSENSFELVTDPFIVRLEDAKRSYAYILFNREGLIKEDIQKIKRYGLPFLIINFKGELEQEFGNFVVKDAGDLFLSIINKDFKPFVDALKELSKNIYPIKMDAFNESIKMIKSSQTISANDFEAIVFSFFNLIFPDSVKWGGPKVADGACIFNLYKNEYLIWDAKRYNTSSLLNYVKNNLEKKDIGYLKRFMRSELVKKKGKLKYYLYITSNTLKEEFINIEKEFKEKVKADGELKSLNIFCMNKNELISFVEFIKKNYKNFIECNKAKFLTLLRKGFTKNSNYFSFDLIKEDLKKLIKKQNSVPLAQELRKIR